MNRLHPITQLLLFLSVIIFSCIISTPYFTIPSLVVSATVLLIKGEFKLKDSFFYMIIILVLGITNPLFTHKGSTPLFFINNNPYTLESLLYGLNIGIMLISIILWFKIQNIYLTDEKLLYIFSFNKNLAIFISMTFRFIPLMKRKYIEISEITGLNNKPQVIMDKIKISLQCWNQLITYALEFAAEIGETMKARKYGETEKQRNGKTEKQRNGKTEKPKNRKTVYYYKVRVMDIVVITSSIVIDCAMIICIVKFGEKLIWQM